MNTYYTGTDKHETKALYTILINRSIVRLPFNFLRGDVKFEFYITQNLLWISRKGNLKSISNTFLHK